MKWRELIAQVPADKMDEEVLIVPRESGVAYSIRDVEFEVVDMDGNIGEDARPGPDTVECILLNAD